MAAPDCLAVKGRPISAGFDDEAVMTNDFGSARENMVQNQVRTNDVTDLAVQDAMREVARERFCMPGRDFLAYAESVVEYAPGWFLMEPREVSKMLQALRPRAGEKALAICAPYAAALLARIGLDVTLLLPKGEPEAAAAKALEGSGVRVTGGDPKTAGSNGPYQVLVCEGAVEQAPDAWLKAVDIGGRLGVVERRGPVGKARLYVRGDDGLIARREVFDATPPVMPGFAAAASFAF
jgi:protein-L-isoaspartate(D-aspartate) O-methyltransferase